MEIMDIVYSCVAGGGTVIVVHNRDKVLCIKVLIIV